MPSEQSVSQAMDTFDKVAAGLRQSADTIEAQAARIAELEGALERQHRNFHLLLRGKPVRDVAETDAEVRQALGVG